MAVQSGSRPDSLFGRALREGFLAGILALGLFCLIIGFKTEQNISNELVLTERWGALAVFVALAAVGRFIFIAFVQPWNEQRKLAKSSHPVGVVENQSFFRAHFSKIGIAFLFVYPILIVALVGWQGSLKWVDNFGVQILIYVMLAWGLNIVVGLAGLLDLGYVAFYAVGAYSYAILSAYFGWSFWVLLPIAGLLAATWGVILGFPVLRLRGDYLAIVTLAFGEIIRLVLINWTELTKGTFGISGIAKATFFGLQFNASKDGFAAYYGLTFSAAHYKFFLYYIILVLALITALVTIRLRRMPVGRAWEALREDEIACRSLGINTTTTKLTAFATGAMFGGFAGSFFAARQGFVSPESFVFLESAVILAIVVLGGMGSLVGIAIAAIAMIGGTEILREMGFLKAIFGPNFTPELYRMLIFGLAMVVVMVWKPRGFVGSREPSAFLNQKKMVSGAFTKEGHG
ncbi:high-affinity branched-chain amino acid ABC transporter permease LivM [Brucella thiophenivorans]|uniref:Branched-chain amino acid transport system / permease component family protein n=1 Tax=Brucella thiophenivorans TaxID=571255 RepID=A0A256G263_9HYPH|nr:high-affinity branched-chain amino acid ABC transporter permease LivM [Brucella thiophenivorans]OYR21163.1 branched-chain amino acid transport system / permease component family protein [Brucella thiophenivorans]